MKRESAADILDDLTQTLCISKTQLAALLHVSERTLADWRSKKDGAIRTKALRMVRLYEVVQELAKKVAACEIIQILKHGRIPVFIPSSTDPITLLEYIVSFPQDVGWRANALLAIDHYKKYNQLANDVLTS